MVAIAKQLATPEAATLDLWRVAETDDLEELRRILPRVADINARNKHGVTALMRAACHGHERMVRILLDHGADPNLARNDRFTALALAAFFGHTETVKTLIDRGARTEIVTRCGTSAHMWAKARTFVEVAHCLESYTPVRTAPAPAPVLVKAPAPAPEPAPQPVVKTLKDPPEIWDLVHEVPRDFNPKSAFLSRLRSMNRSFALRVAALLLVSATGIVGAMLFKSSQAHSVEPDAIPPVIQNSAAESAVSAPASVPETNTEPAVVPSETGVVHNHSSRKTVIWTRQIRPRAATADNVAENGPTKEVPAAPRAVATPQFESHTKKANTTLSPQVIVPAKKAKVIQWP
ncbi:MAG TPA: ankyrin repeat domain-containing protein [Pyrinomonadaceae bacterium]|nr:ankyrin repeat domain-containing protein [Pyrinomonadaceae bacterium]